MRLFAAVQPPAEALEHVERALTAVRGGTDPADSRGPLRWSPPADRHLTVAFYGEVQDGRLPEVAEALSYVASGVEPFPVALRGAGVFDRRTLWIGCADPGDHLAALSREAVQVGAELLGRQDDRVRSRAHLTVARVPGRAHGRSRDRDRRRSRDGSASGGSQVGDLVHALSLYAGPVWSVQELVLVASRLGAGPGGHPLHEVVHRAPLGAVAG